MIQRINVYSRCDLALNSACTFSSLNTDGFRGVKKGGAAGTNRVQNDMYSCENENRYRNKRYICASMLSFMTYDAIEYAKK